MPSTTTTSVYTDGACQGNPGPGGWAWAVSEGPFRSGAEARTTNQRMELRAVLAAVTTFTGPVEVVSDSTYVVNCFKNGWWEGWERKGWKNAKREDVANQDLWRPLIEAYKADQARLSFRWVKGHAGDPMNDLVDRLAVEAAARQEGRSGTGHPTELGPADRPSGEAKARALRLSNAGPSKAEPSTGRAAGDPSEGDRWESAGPAAEIGGYLIVVAGMRPAALGGYGDTLMSASVRRRLTDILDAKRTMHPDLVVVSGFGLGAEQLGVEAAADTGIPYVAVLAFPGQDRPWPPASRDRFARLIAGSKETVTIQPGAPGDRREAGAALGRRDAWLAANAAEAVVVWDGIDEAVAKTVASLRRRLGEEQVWVLEP